MSPILPPDLDPGLTIVLIGKSGAGKSASGNTILGRAAFESKLDFKPVTTEISEQTGNVFRNQISVVDTPGILESEDTEKKIKKYCQDLLQSSRPCLFLVVIRVGRFMKEDQEAVRAAMRVLGPRGMEKSYLLFTGGDMLEGGTLKDFIFQDKKEGVLPDVVRKFAERYHLFDNDKDDEEPVRDLLVKSGHLRTQDQPDPPADDPNKRRVFLIGLPGAGKSSSGNTILRSTDPFKPGGDFNPVSTETVCKSAIVEGRQVTVVDTPGFTDPTGEQLYDGIMKSVVEASPGPHAFVIVVRIGRITETDIKLFKLLQKMFKRDVHKYSMVLFTHGDELGGQSIDGLIRSNQHVSDLVSMCGGRFCVFENKTKRSREQVRDFLSKVDEMVSGNGGQHYTDEMFRMAQTFLKEETNRSGDAEQSKRSVWERFKRFIKDHKYECMVLAAIVGAAIGGGVVGLAIKGGVGAAAAGGVGAAGGGAAAAGGGAAAAGGVGAAAAAGGVGAAAAAGGVGAAAAGGVGAAAAAGGVGAAAVAGGVGAAAAGGVGAAAVAGGVGAAAAAGGGAAAAGGGAAAAGGVGAAIKVLGGALVGGAVGAGAAGVAIVAGKQQQEDQQQKQNDEEKKNK